MKKYPVLKCNKELWNEIKPVLESFGITNFNINKDVLCGSDKNYIVSNYGNSNINELLIGNTVYNNDDEVNENYRYLVSTKEKFLSAVAELLGKEYSIAIHETREDKGKCSATITREKQCKKKNKIENYIISCDPAISESTTVVATMPAKGNDFDKDKESIENINIANKLRHCKQGTKLYHLMFGEVEFDNLDEDDYINIITKDKENNFSDYTVNQFGQYCSSYPNGECLLFPSKDNRDWNSFQVLEEGHRVMVSNTAQNWGLRQYYKNKYAYVFDGNKNTSDTWNYIVPVEDFDFTAEDITINKEKSII